MATFYKYKERDDISKSMIDWSGLTKNISDNLMAEKNRRDQLKQELEEDQLNKIKAVEEFTKGLDPSMNQAMIKVSQQYKDYLLTRHRLMKQGLVSVNDTKIKKQGAIDTFDSINNAAKQYNEKMAEIIEAGGKLNDFMAMKNAEVLNIANSEFVIDDMGRGTFIKIDEDGNELAMPANSFATILNEKYDRFDGDAELDKVTKNLATYTIAESGYRSVEDFRQNKEIYNKWLNGTIDSILNSPKRTAEVAADFSDIDITKDENEAKEKGLLLAEYKNGKRFINTQYAEKKVREDLRVAIEARVDRIEQARPYPVQKTSGDLTVSQKEASALYDLSNRVAIGDSIAFDQIQGRLYSVTNEDGTKKSVKLDRPIMTSDRNIVIRDVSGKEVITLPSGPESALAIANIIRSGESADKIQSLYEEGEKLYKGNLPSLRGGTEEGKNLVSALNDMPENDVKAKEWLSDKLPSDIEVENTGYVNNYIRLTKGQDSAEFKTSDIEGIKAWLDKYNATPMVVGENKSNTKQEPTITEGKVR